MVHIFGHGGLGGDAEIVNPQLILKRYVEGDIYGGLVLLNDNPTSVDSSQSEYSLSLFSDRFDGGIASGTGWPTPLENSHGLFQLIGLAGAATTNKKQLGADEVNFNMFGFDGDSDGNADFVPTGSYESNVATISDLSSIQTIPGVNLIYDQSSPVVRRTYNLALPELASSELPDLVTLTERIPKRPTFYKYGSYRDDDTGKIRDAKEQTFATGFDNGLYVDQEGKIKQVSSAYSFALQPPIFSLLSLFDKYLFNKKGVQTEGIEYHSIFNPASDKFVAEPVDWIGDEESASLGLNYTDRITKYLAEPVANIGHLFRLFLNKKFKDVDESGNPNYTHLASAVEYYDEDLKIKSMAMAGNELAILLDEEGKIHVLSNCTPLSNTTPNASTTSYGVEKSFVNNFFIWYPEKYRKVDWSEHLDSNGVPLDLNSFPYMSSEKYFWMDDSGHLVDTEDVVFISVQAVGSTLTGEGVTVFAIDDNGKLYAREIKSTISPNLRTVSIPDTGQSYSRFIERTKYSSYDSNGVPNSDLDPLYMKAGHILQDDGGFLSSSPGLGFDGVITIDMQRTFIEIGYTLPSDPTDPNAEDLPIYDKRVNDEFIRLILNGDPHRVAAKYRDYTRPESIMIDPETNSPIHEDNSILRFLTASLREIPKDSNGERCPVYQMSDTFEHLSTVVYGIPNGGLSPLVISDDEVVPNYRPGIMHLGVMQLDNANLINSLAKKLSPRLTTHLFSPDIDPLDDSLWGYLENATNNPDKTTSFDPVNYEKLFVRTVGGNRHYIPPRNIGGTRSGIVIHSNNDKIAYITAKQWKGVEFAEPFLSAGPGSFEFGDSVDIDFFTVPHPVYFKPRGVNVVPDYEPWRTYDDIRFWNLFFNRGNLNNFKLNPNNRANGGFNPLLGTWDSKIYPSKTDPNYPDGIPMVGSIHANRGQLFQGGVCYPGFCNPPSITPFAEPGPADNPTPIQPPYLPGIPAHESGALHPYYRGFSQQGESEGGQQYGALEANFFGTDDPDNEEIDWDVFDQALGGNASERILDLSLFDAEGNPLIDIKKNFSFWANSGQLSNSIPDELRNDPNFLKDFRVPNRINERNFINQDNLECIPYPDALGREYRRDSTYVMNSANLTILDANLNDESGRKIEYAAAHADIYYIVLDDGTVRAMSYRVADSDSLVWYPSRGPIDRDVTQARVGIIGDNATSADREVISLSSGIKLSSVATKTKSPEPDPVTPSTPAPTTPTPPRQSSPPRQSPPRQSPPPMSPPSSGGYGY